MSTVLMSNTVKPRKRAMGLYFSKEHFGWSIFSVRGSFHGFLTISGETGVFEAIYKRGTYMYRRRQFINLFLLHVDVHLVFLGNKKHMLKFHRTAFFRIREGYFGDNKIKNCMVLKTH